MTLIRRYSCLVSIVIFMKQHQLSVIVTTMTFIACSPSAGPLGRGPLQRVRGQPVQAQVGRRPHDPRLHEILRAGDPAQDASLFV